MPIASLEASTAPVWPSAANERIIPITVPSSPTMVAIEAMVDERDQVALEQRHLEAVGFLDRGLRLGHDLLLGRALGAHLLVALEAGADDVGGRAALLAAQLRSRASTSPVVERACARC